MKKSPLKSVTLWINLAGGVIVGALGVIGDHGVDASWVAIALAAGNFLLRFKTSQPIV